MDYELGMGDGDEGKREKEKDILLFN